MTVTFRYLHRVNDLCHVLDHQLVPEVSALLCTMASRAPLGGVRARYQQLLHGIVTAMEENDPFPGTMSEYSYTRMMQIAEESLCTYPLHPVVKEFFELNVKEYGHSSPLELTGQPAVYVEGASWYTMWLLFDSPLCAGQEFSTRAVRHRDWPMCFEANEPSPDDSDWIPNPTLKSLHDGWFDLFDADVPAWKDELRSACIHCKGVGRVCIDSIDVTWESCGACKGKGLKYPWIKDPQAFRPALDRSRCLIPTTFSTGCSQTANLRAMSRVVHTGQLLAKRSEHPGALIVWGAIEEAYAAALPGMANMGRREAVYTSDSPIPGHLVQGFSEPMGYGYGFLDDDEICDDTKYEPGVNEVEISIIVDEEALLHLDEHKPFTPEGAKSYIDPVWNQIIQVRFHVQCSLAVARDWHRHRSAYPWQMRLVRRLEADGETWGDFVMHPAYTQMSEKAKNGVGPMLAKSTAAYDEFVANGDHYRAMLTLPLGACVELRASGGLRDMLYMLKLRAHAQGANFEYEAQAKAALSLLKTHLEGLEAQCPGIMRHIGLVE